METVPTILDINRVPEDDREKYKSGLEAAVDFYSIEDNSFSHPKQQVFEGATRLLSEYKMHPEFMDDPEKCLFALSIADCWDEKISLAEKRVLLTILKLVAVGYKQTQEGVVGNTLSDKIQRLSDEASPRGVEYNPQNGLQQSLVINKVESLINTSKDALATEELQNRIDDRDQGSLLYNSRKDLKIRAENERPFKTVVLSLTSKELSKTIFGQAACINRSNETIIVFGSDYYEISSADYFDDSIVEHEYRHAQSGKGLKVGFAGILNSGLDEAVTEWGVQSPNAYESQRKVLRQLIIKDREIEDAICEAYMQRDNNKQRLNTLLIRNLGLRGFLLLSRMSASNNNIEGEVKSKIFIDPKDVLKDLNMEEKLDPDLQALLDEDLAIKS